MFTQRKTSDECRRRVDRGGGRPIVPAALVAIAIGAATQAQFAEPFPPDPAAAAAFDELVTSYRARPALRIKSTLEIRLNEGDVASDPREITAEFTSSGTPDARVGVVKIRDFACYFSDGVFHAVHREKDDAYYHETYEGSPYWPLLINFKDIPYPHLAILWGEAAREDVWMQLHPDSPMIVPTQVEAIERDGETLQRLILSSPQATMTIDVDPRTRLVRRIEHEVTGGHAVQPGTSKVTTYTFRYETWDEPRPPETLAFEPGARERVDLIAALMPPPEPPGPGGAELIGKPAPPFVLATADGAAIDLEELRGKVVVLDFWATWCGPCRRALPLLHEVARWARDEALPVEVIAVNVWESKGGGEDTPDGRLATVRAFWTKHGFTLPVAMDFTDETAGAYGVRGIPATFVIRSDGIVHARPHADVAALQEAITGAIEALERNDPDG